MRSAVAGLVASARSDGSGRKPGILGALDFEFVAGEAGMLAVTRKRIFLDGGRHTVPPEGGKGKAARARVRRK